MLVKIIGE